MMQRYQNRLISKIWSDKETKRLAFIAWQSISKQLHEAGFKGAFKRGKMTGKSNPSNHEVIDLLSKFVRKTGLVNAHAGLTSSDIIDNVRLAQLARSLVLIGGRVGSLIPKLSQFSIKGDGVAALGYTHWQPATQIEFTHRVWNWASVLEDIGDGRPTVRQKSIGGAVGNCIALGILTGGPRGELRVFDATLDAPMGTWMQSTSYLDELSVMQWLAKLGGWLSKIALDIRFLAHTGELFIKRDGDHRGSSSMPKKNNPIEAEKICSLARLLPGYERVLWDAMSNNGLERTLDGSASSRIVLQEACHVVVHMLETMAGLFDKMSINKKRCEELLQQNRQAANVELEMARQIKKGKSRWEVYEQGYYNSRGTIWK